MVVSPHDPPPGRPQWLTQLSELEQHDVAMLANESTEVDGVAPLSEQVLLHLNSGDSSAGDEARHLLLRGAAGELLGYAQRGADEAGVTAELVVRPAQRRQGYGSALLLALRDRAPGGHLRIWAHGQHPGAARLARVGGLRQQRVLWRVRRALTADLGDPVWPDGIAVRTFVPGLDEDRWLACNARAFATHPEQGSWTRTDLDLRERESWFDPAGFFLAIRSEDSLAGFHWTKIHPAARGEGPVGEVYVLGVDPAEQGTGLGRALLRRGLKHLRDSGLGTVMLYVDEDNVPAMTLYERMGFVRERADVMFETT